MAETKKRTTASTKIKVEKKNDPEVKEEIKEEKKYTAEDVAAVMQTPEAQAIIQSLLSKALEEQKKTIVVAPAQDENVSLLYMGAVASDSTVHLNDALGDIQGRAGTRYIPKREFLQNLTPSVTKRLKDRRLIVTNGFTDEERVRYGVKYEDGELLSPTIYQKLIGMSDDKIAEIFEKACFSHKKIITTLLIDAYQANDRRITQSLIERLNEISKSIDPNGMFRAILKDMARGLADR